MESKLNESARAARSLACRSTCEPIDQAPNDTSERTPRLAASRRGTAGLARLVIAGSVLGLGLAQMPAAAADAGTVAYRSAPAQPSAIASTFSVVNYGSGLCLEPLGNGWGEPVLQQPCDGTRLTQRWFLVPATSYPRYLLVNQGTGLCMDVRDGVDANGTVVQVWSCEQYARSMRWALTTLIPDLYFKVVSEVGSRCLDVAWGSLEPWAQLQIYKCTSGVSNTAQIFEFRP